MLQVADKLLDLFQVTLAQRARVGEQVGVLLQPAEQRRLLERERQLGAVEDVPDDDLVPLVPQVLEAGQNVRNVVKQVAQDNDQRSAGDALGQVVEDRRQAGLRPARSLMMPSSFGAGRTSPRVSPTVRVSQSVREICCKEYP